MRIEAKSLDQLLHPMFDTDALKAGEVIGEALPASPGAAAGKVVFTAEEAKELGKGGNGERVILVRLETSPEDIEGMHASQGILTVRGGMTSHAAVVARGMGTCCVSGCGAISIDEEAKQFTLGGYTFTEGDYISLDGSTGKIYKGDIKTVEATVSGNFGRIMAWADEYRKLGVRTNADTPADTKNAVRLGAEGIGLCRTEHMFFGEDRIPKFRRMILSDTVEKRVEALKPIGEFQKTDFKAMYEALEGRPMTVRYLDPPLHEFVPTEEEDIKALADDMGLGKTVQVLSIILDYIQNNKEKQTSLVIAPSSLTLNWKNETEKFAPTLKTLVIRGTLSERKKLIETLQDYDLVITSYDLLKRDIENYKQKDYKFKYIIADEAQYLKNSTTQNAKAIKDLKAQTRYALTGTPIENSLAELWSIFDFIMPGYLYTYKKFKTMYEIPIVKEEDESSMQKLKMLIEPFLSLIHI